jgi:peptide/nickel transport system permease protein
MLQIAVRRILLAIPILVGVSVIIFGLMQVLPGDPAANFITPDSSPEQIAAIRAELGLDQPLPVRYLEWLGAALTGDLGFSDARQREVASLIGQAWGNTAILAAVSAVFGLVVGIGVGILAAVRRGSLLDRALSVFSLTGLSVPSFFLAIVLMTIFAGQWQVLPAGGAVLDEGLPRAVAHLVLPVLSGSLVTLAITARVTRASVIDVYGADFVQTLRAKGLSSGQVLRHVVKNAMSPVLTTSGLQIGALLGGSVLVETIFSWPGMGLLVFNAISARDLVVVQGATLVIAVTFVLVNLAVDLVQTAVDPRLRGAVA